MCACVCVCVANTLSVSTFFLTLSPFFLAKLRIRPMWRGMRSLLFVIYARKSRPYGALSPPPPAFSAHFPTAVSNEHTFIDSKGKKINKRERTGRDNEKNVTRKQSEAKRFGIQLYTKKKIGVLRGRRWWWWWKSWFNELGSSLFFHSHPHHLQNPIFPYFPPSSVIQSWHLSGECAPKPCVRVCVCVCACVWVSAFECVCVSGQTLW